MFENPRRGRQARDFSENDPKILDLKSSSEQIIFRKLSLGAPDKPIVHSGFNSAAKIIYHRTFSNVSSIKQETAALKNPCFFCTHWELTYADLQEKSAHIHGLWSKYTLKEYVDDLFNTEAVGFCWVDIQ